MKKYIPIVLMIATVVLFVNYMRIDSTRTYVYTSKKPAGHPLSLYIDDKYIGELPYVDKNAVNDISSSNALDLSLKYGTHNMTAKNKEGNDISAVKIEVSGFSTSSISLTGSHSQSFTGLPNRHIIVEMH